MIFSSLPDVNLPEAEYRRLMNPPWAIALLVILCVAPSAYFLYRTSTKDVIADACRTYKEKMEAHLQSNPVLTGNYDSFADGTFNKWNQEGTKIHSEFYNILGIQYRSPDSLEQAQKNLQGFFEGAKICYNEGVDLGGFKELKDYMRQFK